MPHLGLLRFPKCMLCFRIWKHVAWNCFRFWTHIVQKRFCCLKRRILSPSERQESMAMNNLVAPSGSSDVPRLCNFAISHSILLLLKPRKLNVASPSSCVRVRVHSKTELCATLNRAVRSAYSFDDGCTDSECELSSQRNGISDAQNIEQQYDDASPYDFSDEVFPSNSRIHTMDPHQDCSTGSSYSEGQSKTDRTVGADPPVIGSRGIPERNIQILHDAVPKVPGKNAYAEWMPDSRLPIEHRGKHRTVRDANERLCNDGCSECNATNEGKGSMGKEDAMSSEYQSGISLHLEDVIEFQSKWPCEPGIEMGENGEAVVKGATVGHLQEKMSMEDIELRNKTGWSETSCDDGSVLKAQRVEQKGEEQEMEKLARQEQEVFKEDVGKTPDDYHRRADIFELTGEAFIAGKMREEARNHIETIACLSSQQHKHGTDSVT